MNIKRLRILFIILFQLLISTSSLAVDEFTFDVTEIEILEEGNIYKGIKKGIARTNDGISIFSNTFLYNKKINELKSFGDVKVTDSERNIKIFSDEIVYKKNKEIISTNKNSKAIYDNKIITAEKFEYQINQNILLAFGDVKVTDSERNIKIFSDEIVYKKNKEIISTNKNSKAIYDNKIITAEKFEYQINQNVLRAKKQVTLEDKDEDFILFTEDLTYFKIEEKIITKGNTNAIVQSKFNINSKNVKFDNSKKILNSNNKTIIKDDKLQIYKLDKFNYSINEKLLKGKNVILITEYNQPKSDSYYFSEGIFDLNGKKFVAKETEIKIHNDVFGNNKNNPRLKGVSSKSNSKKTIVNKGIFTSCNKDSECPAWSIKANKVEHDKEKKQLLYENAVLNIYDIPVFYFPKFFHPDPTVERQSGFLIPKLNNSNVLGSSVELPYFKVISENKDLTFRPSIFDTDMFMPQIEYRQVNKNSSFSADVGLAANYESKTTKKKKNLTHLFAKYNLDLEYENFIRSDIDIAIERVSNDTYLKIFESHLTKSETLRPKNFDNLNNSIKIFLDHENYSLETGLETYEKLKSKKNDRYQFILPYYNYNTSIYNDYLDGSFDFNSNGANDLKNTNQIETNIINNLNYTSKDYFSKFGIKSNYNINLKNLNSSGKNSSKYKSSPQLELMSIYNINVTLPLIKETETYTDFLTPKLSFRFNPSDMKNYSSSNNQVNVNNIFSLNRLGLSDTFESGKSLTFGLDFKKEKKDTLDNVNQYYEFKIASVLRDKKENFISEKSTLNNKHSNLFGAINTKFSENLDIKYNFSLDNDYSTLDRSDLSAVFSFNNIKTNFNFIEENNKLGNTNVLESSIRYNYDENNFLTFSTRRNRKINLTEYYDLVYEYKNDCITAGIKYNKKYYSDRDLKPEESLLFTVTLVPLSSYEYDAESLIKN